MIRYLDPLGQLDNELPERRAGPRASYEEDDTLDEGAPVGSYMPWIRYGGSEKCQVLGKFGDNTGRS